VESSEVSMNVYMQDLALAGVLIEFHIIPSTWILLSAVLVYWVTFLLRDNDASVYNGSAMFSRVVPPCLRIL
jgi:hypothetical protein